MRDGKKPRQSNSGGLRVRRKIERGAIVGFSRWRPAKRGVRRSPEEPGVVAEKRIGGEPERLAQMPQRELRRSITASARLIRGSSGNRRRACATSPFPID